MITKTLFVMKEKGISELEMKASLEGVQELLKLGNAEKLIGIEEKGELNGKEYLDNDGVTNNFRSIDWYLQKGRATSRNETQLNAGAILEYINEDVCTSGNTHFDLLIVHSDMYSGNTEFVIGNALKGIGTIISISKFNSLSKKTRCECIKTQTMHEMGHVFGLLPATRKINFEYNLGKHCTNKCIMRQGLILPFDWIVFTCDRKRFGALCATCLGDLRDFFSANE